MIRRLACTLLLALPLQAPAQAADTAGERGFPAPTVAESSNFQRTASHEQVMTICAQLADTSDRITLDSMGTSTNGRDIPLLILADPPIENAENAHQSGKLVVFLFGAIHAGEVCGKEALLMLARDLGLGERADLLDDLVLLIAPIYNPDGNDEFDPANRPGQLGPIEMGERENADGLDLNRDYVKLEAPETRALTRLLSEWDPHLTVDTHTTNGSHHRYLITYLGPRHPAGDAEIVSYTRDTLLPAIDARFEDQTDWNAFFYGNFSENHSKWTTYPAEPRYGAASRGLRNRLSI
ncbi:MAG: M14 family metallopeptidase, partial [Phycisphaerales bacterium JB059]